MLIQPEGDSFIIDHGLGVQFCTAIERTNSKNSYIYLSCDGSVFSMFAQSQLAFVMVHIEVAGGTPFQGGVESSKFIALFKKLYPGSRIKLTPVGNSLRIEEDNISVTFPTLEFYQPMRMPVFETLQGDEAKWLMNAVSAAYSSVGKTKRFQGVLVDNTGAVARVFKFSHAAWRSIACTPLSCATRRFVVSDEMSRAIYSFKDNVVGVFVGENHLGLRLDKDVFFYMPLWADEIGEYVGQLGLVDGLPQVEVAGDRYAFDRKQLTDVLDLISAVVGTDESQVHFEQIGRNQNCTVWKVSAVTFSKCEASETIQCVEPGPYRKIKFRVHKNKLLSGLKSYGERIDLYDAGARLILADNESFNDVTLFPKASG